MLGIAFVRVGLSRWDVGLPCLEEISSKYSTVSEELGLILG